MTRKLWALERGAGMPLVVLHGLTIDHRMMLPLDPTIARTGEWRRHYLDLPGHGASAPINPMTPDDVVDAVADHIRQVIGDHPFAVVGASFGGEVAIAITELFGDQVLGSALLAPSVLPWRNRTLPDNTVSGKDEALLKNLSATDRAAFAAVTAQQDLTRWKLFREHIRPGLLAHDQSAVTELATAQADLEPRHPRAHLGKHVIISGKQDAVVGWRDHLRLLDCYPYATYAVLERCGHNVHLEHPETVGRFLTDWLHALRD